MNITKSNEHIWRNLYEAAHEFQKLAPWKWMYDDDLFGVENPADDSIGYCCVMGNAGEMYALAVYLGIEGLRSYWETSDTAVTSPLSAMFIQKCLMVSFEETKYLEDEDKKQIDTLGFSYKRGQAKPQFRDYSPGYAPWFINEEQAIYLTTAIKQAIGVAKKYQLDDDYLDHEEEPEAYLLRVCKANEDGLTWQNKWEIPALEEENENEDNTNNENDSKEGKGKVIDMASAAKISWAKSNLPKQDSVFLVDLAFLPTPVMGEERPYYPQLFIWIDAESGMIIMPEDDIDEIIYAPGEFENNYLKAFFTQLESIGHIPERIVLSNEALNELLAPIAESLDIELHFDPDDMSLQMAQMMMMQMLSGGNMLDPDLFDINPN